MLGFAFNKMETKIKLAWVYDLRKSGVIKELIKHNLETGGTLTVVRQRLVKFIRSHPELFAHKEEDPVDFDEDADISRDVEEDIANSHISTSSPNANQLFSQSAPRIMDIMRKWNCQFNGRDVYTFLESIEEFRQGYGMDEASLIQGIPVLLKGKAQDWYRNREKEYTWEQFKSALYENFTTLSERRNMEREIEKRIQDEKEGIREFVTQLKTLMRRRGGYTEKEILDRVFLNMSTENMRHVSRYEYNSIDKLILRIEELEEVKQIELSRRPRSKTTIEHIKRVAPVKQSVPNSIRCWNCGEEGHTRINCKNTKRIFCNTCGKVGVLTKDCHPRTSPSGNASRGES